MSLRPLAATAMALKQAHPKRMANWLGEVDPDSLAEPMVHLLEVLQGWHTKSDWANPQQLR